MKPLNGEKTHPLSTAARECLTSICRSPVPVQEVNPGLRDRLLREALVEVVMLPSPYKTIKGEVAHFSVTPAGRTTTNGTKSMSAVNTTTNWDGTRCLRCGYVVKLGNRRTPESRRNWVAYCVERHDRTHGRTGAETKESTAAPATAMTADTITDEQVKSVRDELAKVRQNARTRSICQDCSAALEGSRVCRESAAAAWNELHANPAAWNRLLANRSSSSPASPASSALTDLEREVMVAVREGLDPWKEVGGGGSRLVSQAIGRCERNGFLKESQGYTVRYLVTAAGRRALGDDADRTY